MRSRLHNALVASAAVVLSLSIISTVDATTLRIATYNVNLDTSDFAAAGGSHAAQLANIETVIEGIGSVHLNDNGISNAQPLDVLALQELATPVGQFSASLTTIVSNLNATYGAGTYAYALQSDPTDAGGTGNGPSGLIYNTKTVQIIGSTVLGTASGSGAPRAPLQFQIRPVGYSSAADFYVDVSHMKSTADSSATTDAQRRNSEAATLVNAANALGPNAHIVSLGDFNIANGSNEQTYKTMQSAFDDPAVPNGVWSDTSTANARAISSLLSESATDVRYRDDIQFTSPAADPHSGVAGLEMDAGSLSVFGNGGSSLLVGNSINTAADNPSVFPDFTAAYRAMMLSALANASDHLPVVADYDIVGIAPVPEPAAASLLVGGSFALLVRRRRMVRS